MSTCASRRDCTGAWSSNQSSARVTRQSRAVSVRRSGGSGVDTSMYANGAAAEMREHRERGRGLGVEIARVAQPDLAAAARSSASPLPLDVDRGDLTARAPREAARRRPAASGGASNSPTPGARRTPRTSTACGGADFARRDDVPVRGDEHHAAGDAHVRGRRVLRDRDLQRARAGRGAPTRARPTAAARCAARPRRCRRTSR